MSKILSWWFGLLLFACAGKQVVAGSAVQTASPAGASYTVVLRHGHIEFIPALKLSLELLTVQDSRCPPGARCVWAGQATATLLVRHAGGAPVQLVVGTPTPPAMHLPFQAQSGDFQFTLKALEPLPGTQGAAADKLVRVTLLVEKIPLQDHSSHPI